MLIPWLSMTINYLSRWNCLHLVFLCRTEKIQQVLGKMVVTPTMRHDQFIHALDEIGIRRWLVHILAILSPSEPVIARVEIATPATSVMSATHFVPRHTSNPSLPPVDGTGLGSGLGTRAPFSFERSARLSSQSGIPILRIRT